VDGAPNAISLQIIRAYFNMKALERVALLLNTRRPWSTPEVECIGKGMAIALFEFGCGVTICAACPDAAATAARPPSPRRSPPADGGLVPHAKVLPRQSVRWPCA